MLEDWVKDVKVLFTKIHEKDKAFGGGKDLTGHIMDVVKSVAVLGFRNGPGSVLVGAAMMKDSMSRARLSHKAVFKLLKEYSVPTDRALFITDIVQSMTDIDSLYDTAIPQAEVERISAKRLRYSPKEAVIIKVYERIENLRALNDSVACTLWKLGYIKDSHEFLGHCFDRLQNDDVEAKVLNDIVETNRWAIDILKDSEERKDEALPAN